MSATDGGGGSGSLSMLVAAISTPGGPLSVSCWIVSGNFLAREVVSTAAIAG